MRAKKIADNQRRIYEFSFADGMSDVYRRTFTAGEDADITSIPEASILAE
jgi:hypothetical protein